MKVSALIATAAALSALLTPAGYAQSPKRPPHHRPAIRVTQIASATARLAPTETLPANTAPVASWTVQANDPSAVDCTYMVCAGTTIAAAGATTAAPPLIGASLGSTPQAPVSQFCADNSYMC